ncbi:hypothetical protein [Streptomyces sp. AS02]|uniref:hypothetical protein n=1 Tax=Streptomyces sp. AS02 TaxID=2938946 RepID=UPI00201FEFC2|nr:hypothetical protein [Streptomyces sp. AS02]MCL8013964.1 hypothetical protein [Streptomyces sp. AS02]
MYRPFVGVLALVLLLAGCGSASVGGTSADPRPSGSVTASSATDDPPPTPTPSAPPSTPPTAADGTRYSACADGTCEVRVTKEAGVPVPERFGLGPVMVSAISGGTVTLIAPLTRSEFSSDGGCEVSFTGPGAGSSAFAQMTCDSGAKAVVNRMGLQVVHVGDGAAILRISPAA